MEVWFGLPKEFSCRFSSLVSIEGLVNTNLDISLLLSSPFGLLSSGHVMDRALEANGRLIGGTAWRSKNAEAEATGKKAPQGQSRMKLRQYRCYPSSKLAFQIQ
jgi:hypothetical protein